MLILPTALPVLFRRAVGAVSLYSAHGRRVASVLSFDVVLHRTCGRLNATWKLTKYITFALLLLLQMTTDRHSLARPVRMTFFGILSFSDYEWSLWVFLFILRHFII